jgi:hypothetical protein
LEFNIFIILCNFYLSSLKYIYFKNVGEIKMEAITHGNDCYKILVKYKENYTGNMTVFIKKFYVKSFNKSVRLDTRL